MKKSEIQFYSETQIHADIDFLKFQMEKKMLALFPVPVWIN